MSTAATECPHRGSSISHELRTPLTNICAYAEILQLTTPGECAEWHGFVRVIASEGHALSATVDAVLDYLQLESGDAGLRQETIDATTLVRAEAQAASAEAQRLGVEIQFETEGETPSVHVDAARMRQVARHLIDTSWINQNYLASATLPELVRDFIAGMTDTYFAKRYEECVIPRRIEGNFSFK